MNEREKKLLLVILILVIPLGGYLVYGQFDSAKSKYQNSISKLDKKIKEQESIIRRGSKANRTIKSLRDRSLPGNTVKAETHYRGWLTVQLHELEMDNVNVTPATRGSFLRSPRKNTNKTRAFDELSYTVSAEGDLRQFVKFLHKFYSLDCLHRIRSITAKPIKDSKKIKLDLGIDTLVIPGTEEHANLEYLAASDIDDLKAYADVIINRNLYAPPNNPPKLNKIGNKEISNKEPLSLTVNAIDADERDKITYSIKKDPAQEGDIPEIDPKSGKLTLPPQEIGKYKFTVLATDDGIPSITSEETFEVNVVKEEPRVVEVKKPDFEDAKLTVATGSTKSRNRWMVWLHFLATDETLWLFEGDTFELGKLKGVIHRIGRKDVELTAADRRLLVKLGQKISEGEELRDTKNTPSSSGSSTP